MEPKVFNCSLCAATRSSKFALKRHQRSEHAPSSKTASACPVVATKVATSQPHAKQTCKITQKSKLRHGSYRAVIHQTVHQLLARHRRHTLYFRTLSAEIAEDLRRGTRDHKFDRVVYFAIAVTAKVFAGGKYVPCASGHPRLEVRMVAAQTKPPELAETARPPCMYLVTTPATLFRAYADDVDAVICRWTPCSVSCSEAWTLRRWTCRHHLMYTGIVRMTKTGGWTSGIATWPSVSSHRYQWATAGPRQPYFPVHPLLNFQRRC